jgi:uncharacterized SAM-binding protein YcdF (DUF218 family)
MFLFFSKLFPALLNPIGLSCLLLVLAVMTFWKRPRVAAGAVGAALGILLLGSNFWVSKAFVQGLESQYRPATAYPRASAIVILGGATHPPLKPRVWPELNEAGDRILYTARLYREGAASKVIITGGRISWKEGTNSSEAQDIETLLTFMGVPKSAMLLDRTSLNTHENAVNVKRIMVKESLNEPVLLVTSAIHMPRSMAIFKKEGILAIAAPTDYLAEEEDTPLTLQEITLKLLPDVEAIFQTNAALKEYVGLLTYRLKGWA